MKVPSDLSQNANEQPVAPCRAAPLSSVSSVKEPRRFVRMFQPRFAEMVEDGRKRQTLRPTPKRMPEPGDLISLRAWTGKPYRSKQRVLKEAVVVGVEPISISASVLGIGLSKWVYGFGRTLSMDSFARRDGFKDFPEMAAWFEEQHGLPFNGILIRWEEVQP